MLEIATPIGLAALVVMQSFAMIRERKRSDQNGRVKASVEPKDALVFWEANQAMARQVDAIDKKLDAGLVVMREILEAVRERRRR